MNRNRSQANARADHVAPIRCRVLCFGFNGSSGYQDGYEPALYGACAKSVRSGEIKTGSRKSGRVENIGKESLRFRHPATEQTAKPALGQERNFGRQNHFRKQAQRSAGQRRSWRRRNRFRAIRTVTRNRKRLLRILFVILFTGPKGVVSVFSVRQVITASRPHRCHTEKQEHERPGGWCKPPEAFPKIGTYWQHVMFGARH